MKQRVADYIADFLAAKDISDIFTITGGGAMHLNDAFGHNKTLKCTYYHHEQACAIAAEAYARINNKIAAVCVTSGPGGTNAITGVLGAWLDSIPMLIISGQVKYETTVDFSGLNLRQLGDQEFYITKAIGCMTKYSLMITDPNTILYHLEKALFLAKNKRPGPVWLDIPLNVQGAIIETEELEHFVNENTDEVPKITKEQTEIIISAIEKAKSPVIMVGSGVRIAGAQDELIELIEKLQIPVVSAWNAHDLIWDSFEYYCGRPGTVGTRGGNFVVQNADLLLVLGSRLNIRQISYNWENFAKKAYKIIVDIDELELQKPTIKADMPIYADVKDVINSLLNCKYTTKEYHKTWLKWCKKIDAKYPAAKASFALKQSPINPYTFFDILFKQLSPNDTIVASNGSACVCSFQAAKLQKGQRLFTNSGCASMGYGLPASIGAAINKQSSRVICIEGDGSIQMNIQELQTIIHNNLNIKIIWLNNDGYHSIRQTQNNLFKAPLCGVNSQSGISFPSAQAIAKAYGYDYYKVESSSNAQAILQNALNNNNPVIIEAIIDPTQNFEPKLSAKKLPDGKMISPSLEDMYPFLTEEEMKTNIYSTNYNE